VQVKYEVVWKIGVFSTNISLYFENGTRYDHRYNRRRIGTRVRSYGWCHFQWPPMTPDISFKFMIFWTSNNLKRAVSDAKVVMRSCAHQSLYSWTDDCKSDQPFTADALPEQLKEMSFFQTLMGIMREHSDVKTNVCVCGTESCNGAVMTSSFGHVIIMVALLINVVIGYLL